MEVEFDVKITSGVLYEYMLHHTYGTFSGILGTVVGLFLIVNFFLGGGIGFLAAGIVIVGYIPVTLFTKSKRQMLMTPSFKKPIHYKLTEEGVEVSQGGEVEKQSWDSMVKAVSTRSSIVLYTSRINASIFPRKDLREQRAALIEMISTHMPPNKVKIRG